MQVDARSARTFSRIDHAFELSKDAFLLSGSQAIKLTDEGASLRDGLRVNRRVVNQGAELALGVEGFESRHMDLNLVIDSRVLGSRLNGD